MKKKGYVKSLKEYEGPFELDTEALLAAYKSYKAPKKPTSIALDESTIRELKSVAANLGIRYQVLMRSLIIDGLARYKKKR